MNKIHTKSFIFSIIAQVVIFIVIIIMASHGLFQKGMFSVHDFLHTARIAEMARGIGDGQLPVIWSQNFSFGYGMPLFQFYSPVPYFLGGLLLLATNDPILTTKIFWVIPTLLLASGIYVLTRKLLKSPWIALAATSLAVLAPYRAVQLFLRGSLAEAWAMGWYVWLLLGLLLLAKREKWGFTISIISATGIILSHNISVLLVVIPTLLFWVGIQLSQPNTRKSILENSLSLLLLAIVTLGLTAFYTMPSILEKQFTHVDQYVLAEYFNFENHFVYIRQLFIPSWGYGGSEWGAQDRMSFFLGFMQLLLIGVLVLIFGKNIRTNYKKRNYIFIAILVSALFSVVMTTAKSLFVWQNISILSYIQFPWRFLGVATLFIALLGAYTLSFLPKKTQVTVSVLTIIATIVPAYWYFRPEFPVDVSQQYYRVEENFIASELSQYLPDYMYANVSKTNADLMQAECFDANSDTTLNENCKIELQMKDSNKQIWQIQTNQTAEVVLPVANYPGWEVSIDNLIILHQERDGLISFQIDEGNHTISLHFGNTTIRRVSWLISLITFAVLGLYAVVHYIKSKKIAPN